MDTNVKNQSPGSNGQTKNFQQGKSPLESFASSIVAKNHFIKASFGGFAGSGKSRTSAEFVAGAYKQLGCTKPILIIDNEKGSRFLIPFFKKELSGTQVIVKDTTQLADVLKAMEFLNDGEVDFLLIDSLSKVWYKYVQDYKVKNRVTFMQLMDWGKILPAWQSEFSDKFVNISGSIVFTGRGGFTYDKEEEEKDEYGKVTKKASFVKSGVKMKMAGETPFEPDLNIWMEQEQEMTKEGINVWREAQIMKDRSGVIDGKTFKNPTYKDFKPVVDFLAGLPTGEVKSETNTNNLAPSENFESMDRKNKRIIALEEIENAFNAMGIGTSNEAKKIKVHILETLFKTASWKAIELTDLDALEHGILILKNYKQKHLEQKPESLEQVEKILTQACDEVFEFDKL